MANQRAQLCQNNLPIILKVLALAAELAREALQRTRRARLAAESSREPSRLVQMMGKTGARARALIPRRYRYR